METEPKTNPSSSLPPRGRIFDAELAGHDALHRGQNVPEVLERGERDIFSLAVRDEVPPRLGKEQIRLLGRREIRDAVAGIEKHRSLILREIRVGTDLQRLIVAEIAERTKKEFSRGGG